MINNIQIEICLGNIQDVEILNKYPVDRIELNSALELGGLTPSLSTLIAAKTISNKKIICMVRPRGGDFNYTEDEYQVMLNDAKLMLDNGADGLVFGFLKPDKTIDIKRTKTMVDLIHSYQKEAVFHKAFDEVPDLKQACQLLVDLKVDRILTSGQAAYENILEGCERINMLHRLFGQHIELLPGGGVRTHNIKDVINICKTNQIHMTSKTTYPGKYVGLQEEQLVELLKIIETI